jgi:MFS transporter, OFA family, oxalate/formate antiporter
MDARASGGRAGRLFYGWVVVGAAFALMFVGFGTAYSFASFFDALTAEFAASRGRLSLVFSIAGFLYFTLGAVSGPLSDRFGPRPVIGLGVLITAFGLIAAGAGRSLLEVLVAYGFGIGVGVGFSYVPAVGVVQRWFVRRRGAASGLAVAGIGVGTIVMPPIAAALIPALGWRASYVALGLAVLVIGLGATWLMEGTPVARGLGPDGDPLSAVGAAPPVSGLTLPETLRQPRYWALYACCVGVGFGVFVPFVHLVPYAQDRGVPRGAAIALFTLLGVGSTASRFAFGGPADRFGRRRSLTVLVVGMALLQLWWLGAERFWSLAVYALLFGACYGGFVALIPALTVDYFGARSAGGIIGILYTSVALGTLAGPPLAGFAFDVTESYRVPIAAGALCALAAAAGLTLMPDPPDGDRPRKPQAPG